MERKRPLPTVEYLRERLRYDPVSGSLFWRPRPETDFKDSAHCGSWNTRYAGRCVGCPTQNGYLVVRIAGQNLLVHRVVWALAYGAWPREGVDLDHLNGHRADNRLTNLREASRSQNMRNARLSSINSSGVCGVTRRGPRWLAYILGDRLGLFDSLEEAASTRKAASLACGFTERHGTTS